MTATERLTRRGLLQTGAAIGGGLVVGIGVPASSRASTSSAVLTAFITVASTGAVTIAIPSQEMGQGVLSSLAQVVAEELRCRWDQVHPVLAPPDAAFANPLSGAQITAASSSVRGYYQALLTAGATAREMLIAAGAAVLGVAVSDCIGQAGSVVSGSTGKSVSYGSIAAAAALLVPPVNPPLYSATHKTLIGKPVSRPDLPGKVTGRAVYGLDVRVPGMCYGAVRMCPTVGGTVASIGAAPAGASVVNLGTGVALVLDHTKSATTWAAIQAVNKLKITWTLPANTAELSSGAIVAAARGLLKTGTPVIAECAGDYQKAFATAKIKKIYQYTLPYLAHATAEPPCCTASVTATACTLWAPTQAPGFAQATAASITGLPLTAVVVHPVLMGGGLGRKLEQDFIAFAVMASRAVGAPVKLMWPREQDLAADQYRPMAVCQVSAGLDATGAVTAWGYRNVSPSILFQRGYVADGQLDTQATEGSAALPYALGARQIDWVRHTAPIPVGFWRSVGFSINSFAVESAIDEIALAAGVDPLSYRQKLLAGNARALRVLAKAAKLAQWAAAPAAGHARGMAYVECFGSLAATIVEITETVGIISVVNVWCVVDCGMVVNPNTAAQQIEGGIVQGMGAALWSRVPFVKGQSLVTNFLSYPLPRMIDMPVVSVEILETPGVAMGGLGEVGVPGMAPALANAWAKLMSKRLRSLPLFPV